MQRFFLLLILAATLPVPLACAQQQTSPVTIDATAPGAPFPHFWEQMFGSGRAILTLRESYRDDMRAVRQVTDFRYVRFHAILHDEVGVYNEDEHGNAIYNFSYVDQIYDGLLKQGVRPVVEISFMPKKLAFNPDQLHPFWYKQNVSVPRSMEAWDALMKAFAQHLVDRYGIEEVSQWYFEVWNEPNIDFWGGVPRQKTYFDLYAHTARSLKAVSPRLRVGGPATAAANWIGDFLKWTAENHVPVDFVSTHGYADDTVKDLFAGVDNTFGMLPPGVDPNMPMDERVCRAVEKVRSEIAASATPQLPLFWTEWNVEGEHNSRDTTFVGPALANTVRQCDGKGVDMMSFWTFSDVFEEGGPIAAPFEGDFGLRAKGGINKPSYYGFALLHQLGSQRLAVDSPNVIATRSASGELEIAAWNLVDPGKQGTAQSLQMAFTHVPADARVTIERVDDEHGNVLPKYAAMGRPKDPTPAQAEQLNRETALGAPTQARLTHGKLTLQMEPNALVLVRIARQ